jgi:WD40 repeat protein
MERRIKRVVQVACLAGAVALAAGGGCGRSDDPAAGEQKVGDAVVRVRPVKASTERGGRAYRPESKEEAYDYEYGAAYDLKKAAEELQSAAKATDPAAAQLFRGRALERLRGTITSRPYSRAAGEARELLKKLEASPRLPPGGITPAQKGEEDVLPGAGAGKPVRVDLLGDPLPPGAVACLGTPRLCFWQPWLAFSPDARLLAIGNSHEGVHLCEVRTGKELWRAVTPSRNSFYPGWQLLAFSPDAKMLAFGSWEGDVAPRPQGPKGAIWLWDVSTGRELHKLRTDVDPRVLVFDPAGRSLAVGGYGGTIELWDPAGGKLVRRLGDLTGVTGLAFTPDGKTLTAWSAGPKGWQERVFTVWDLVTGRERTRSTRVTEGHYTGALAPDGRCFADPTADAKSILLIDPATGKERGRTEGEGSRPGVIAFSGDSQLLTATSTDGVVRVWETATGKRVRQFRALPTDLDSVALSGDGKLLALTGREDMGLHLWDMARERELHAFPGHRHGPLDVAFLPDGRTVATVNREHSQRGPIRDWADWSLCRWDAASGKELARTRTDPGGEVRLTAFSPDGSLAVTVIHDGTLRLWDVAAGKELRHWQVPTHESTTRYPTQVIKDPYPAITEPAFSPDGKVLLAAQGRMVSRWEVATGKELPAFTVPPTYSAVSRCFASPDGRTLLVTAEDTHPPDRAPTAQLLFLNAASGNLLRGVPARPGSRPPHCCAFAPDGKTLAVEDEAAVQLWEVASRQERGRLRTPCRFVTALAFSPDSRVLATAGGVPR